MWTTPVPRHLWCHPENRTKIWGPICLATNLKETSGRPLCRTHVILSKSVWCYETYFKEMFVKNILLLIKYVSLLLQHSIKNELKNFKCYSIDLTLILISKFIDVSNEKSNYFRCILKTSLMFKLNVAFIFNPIKYFKHEIHMRRLIHAYLVNVNYVRIMHNIELSSFNSHVIVKLALPFPSDRCSIDF